MNIVKIIILSVSVTCSVNGAGFEKTMRKSFDQKCLETAFSLYDWEGIHPIIRDFEMMSWKTYFSLFKLEDYEFKKLEFKPVEKQKEVPVFEFRGRSYVFSHKVQAEATVTYQNKENPDDTRYVTFPVSSVDPSKAKIISLKLQE